MVHTQIWRRRVVFRFTSKPKRTRRFVFITIIFCIFFLYFFSTRVRFKTRYRRGDVISAAFWVVWPCDYRLLDGFRTTYIYIYCVTRRILPYCFIDRTTTTTTHVFFFFVNVFIKTVCAHYVYYVYAADRRRRSSGHSYMRGVTMWYTARPSAYYA